MTPTDFNVNYFEDGRDILLYCIDNRILPEEYAKLPVPRPRSIRQKNGNASGGKTKGSPSNQTKKRRTSRGNDSLTATKASSNMTSDEANSASKSCKNNS